MNLLWVTNEQAEEPVHLVILKRDNEAAKAVESLWRHLEFILDLRTKI